MNAARTLQAAASTLLLLTPALHGSETANPLPTDATLEQVLDAHYRAIGGLEAWQAVETMRVESRIRVGPADGKRIEYRARPGSYRWEIKGPQGSTTTLFDGENVLSYPLGSPAPRPVPPGVATQLARRARIGGTLLAAATEPIQLELKGTERYRGSTYFVVAYSPEPDLTVEYLIERYDLLVEWVRGSRPGGPTAVSEYRDYREVDGLMIPFKIDMDNGQQTRVEDVELNLDLPEDLFRVR